MEGVAAVHLLRCQRSLSASRSIWRSALTWRRRKRSRSTKFRRRSEVTMAFHVDSEVGVLKQVIVHRPGLELMRLTPSNVDDLLFDDVMWAQRAQEEHDAFVQKLRNKGVTVHLFHELLAQALDQPGAREFVQDELTTATRFGPALDKPLDELVGVGTRRAVVGGPDRWRPQAGSRSGGSVEPAAGVPRSGRLLAEAAAEPPVPA